MSYRAPKYVDLPAYVTPGWVWNASTDAPSVVVACDDSNDDFLLVAFWSERNLGQRGAGTEFGLFPLGSGDERLSPLPITGHWKLRDSSLTSTGLLPQGLITLRAPVVDDAYFTELLAGTGLPMTRENLEAVTRKVNQLFLIKASEFISSRDPGAVDRFLDSHAWYQGAGSARPQSVLDDLAASNYGVLPYIQNLPARVRAIMLETARNGDIQSALAK